MQTTTIVYTAILRYKHKILSEYTECSGNFSQIITHIMEEVVLETEDQPPLYKACFIYGKYAFYLIKSEKVFIITMTPNIINANKDLVYCLLYYIHDLLQKKYTIEKLGKMRAYSITDFTNQLKESIQYYYSNQKFMNKLLNQVREIEIFDDLDNKYFEENIQLPVLSNIQVHPPETPVETIGTINTEETGGEMSSFRYETFKDDLLNLNAVTSQDGDCGGYDGTERKSIKRVWEDSGTKNGEDGDKIEPFVVKSSLESDFKNIQKDLNKERKKFCSKKSVIIILIVAFVLVVGLGTGAFFIFNK